MNFVSAILFYFATFFLHQGLASTEARLDSGLYILARQALGLMVFGPLFIWHSLSSAHIIKPSRWIFLRCISNLIALIAFYQAVQTGGAGKANVLNMTYPAFVILCAYPLLREIPSIRQILLLILCLGGVLFGFSQQQLDGLFLFHFSTSDLWGLSSGALAGISIVSLRGERRKGTNPIGILFWLFLSGSLASLFLYREQFALINTKDISFLILSASCGVTAQLCLTLSYSKLDALTGSIISTSRIPIALFLGSLLLSESFLWNEWLGATTIFIVNLLLASTWRWK